MHAVLKETLRLFTSAPLVARTSVNEPLVIPSTTQLYLPPKTQIMMASLLTHKRPDLWGPDAEAFRPERWFDPALLDKITSTPFMYSPFYGGPRAVGGVPTLTFRILWLTLMTDLRFRFAQCLGREFSLNQAGYFIVRLLQRFQAFRFAPEFMPAGSLPPAHWAGMPGRQGVEKIHPAINFTMHSKVCNFIFFPFSRWVVDGLECRVACGCLLSPRLLLQLLTYPLLGRRSTSFHRLLGKKPLAWPPFCYREMAPGSDFHAKVTASHSFSIHPPPPLPPHLVSHFTHFLLFLVLVHLCGYNVRFLDLSFSLDGGFFV